MPVAAYPAPVQEPPYRGYWRALLLWGVILAVVGWIFVYNGMHSAANDISNSFSSNDYTDSGNDGGEILFGGALVAIGSLMWLPGVIGWGIHASGLTRPRTAAAPQRFDRTYAPPLNLTSSGQ